MSDPIEDECLRSRAELIAKFTPIKLKFDAKRDAVQKTKEALGSRLETNLQFLGGNTDEYSFAIRFFAETVTLAAVTLTHGNIYMSEGVARQYTGIRRDHVLPKGKRHQAPNIEQQFVDDGPDRILTYSLNDIPIMVEKFHTNESRLIVPAFSALLSRAVENNKLQVAFDLCQMVRDHDPLPALLPQGYIQIAE